MRDICRSDRSADLESRDVVLVVVVVVVDRLSMKGKDPLFRLGSGRLFRQQMPITMGHLVAVRLVSLALSPPLSLAPFDSSANLAKTLPILTANK